MHYTIERGMRMVPDAVWRPVMQESIDAFYQGRYDDGRRRLPGIAARERHPGRHPRADVPEPDVSTRGR